MVTAGACPITVLRLSPDGCHVPPNGSRSAVDACHTPCVVAIAHDASCQLIQVHPLIVGQLNIAGAEICLQVFKFRRPRKGQDVFTTTDDPGESDLPRSASLCRGHRFDQAARQLASAERRVGHQRSRLKIEYSDYTAAIG